MSDNALFRHLPALCNVVRRIAVEAGDLTLQYFDESGVPDAMVKADGSPVTLADRAAENVIIDGLRAIDPAIPVVAEEMAADGNAPDVTGAARFWLVDPLDGTKGFISGSGEYSVNIALIDNGVPVLGVVYAPVTGELYSGCGPGTASRLLIDQDSEKDIQCRRAPKGGLTVMASRHHHDAARTDAVLQSLKVEKVLKRGSSLKFCAVASGKADLYVRYGLTAEWDTAAGHAVLLSAGGDVIDEKGRSLTYGHASRKYMNDSFAAVTDDVRPMLDGVFFTPGV